MSSNQQLAKHPLDQAEVMAYLDGELPVEQATTVAAHLGECSDCQRLASDLKYVSEALMSLEIEPVSDQINPAIATALDHRETKETQPHHKGRRSFNLFRRVPPWAWGVPVVGLAALLLVIWSAPSPRSRQVARFAEEQSLDATGSDAMADRVLSAPAAKMKSRSQSFLSPSSSPGPAALLSAQRPAAPMVARTAAINLTTSNFDKTRSALDDLLRRRQGYMGQLNVITPTEGVRNLTATLRVPADQLEPALTDLKALGHLQSESQSGDEVSAQYVDLQARLQNDRNTEERLTALLHQQTGKLSDVLAVETESSRVRGEIESMEAEKKLLETRVAFATLNVTIAEEFKAQMQMVPNSIGTRFRNAAVDGYQSVVSGLVAFLLFLVAYGPSLLLWTAVLFFPIRLLWKRWLRRRTRTA